MTRKPTPPKPKKPATPKFASPDRTTQNINNLIKRHGGDPKARKGKRK